MTPRSPREPAVPVRTCTGTCRPVRPGGAGFGSGTDRAGRPIPSIGGRRGAYPGAIDARIRRFEQALTALALAAAFAFAARWLATLWLVLLTLSLAAEPIAPLRRAGAALAGRLPGSSTSIDAAAVRFATILAVGFLAGGCALLWLGFGALGWVLVLGVAAAAALAALTQLCMGCEIYAFVRRRHQQAR